MLVVSGFAKMVRPDGFATLLRSFSASGVRRVRTAKAITRLVGAAEVLLGSTVLLVGSVGAVALVAAAYLLFAGVVLIARAQGAESCGCFGAVAAPPSAVHVTVNLCSAAAALLAVIVGPEPVSTVFFGRWWNALAYALLLGVSVWLVVAMNTTGAAMMQMLSLVSSHSETFRANAVAAGTGHQHDNVRQGRPSGRDSARRARAALEGRG
ncbi:MAG: MauE/DoxX family redox-associated membrane protein [Actinomycetes bacterium]